MVTSLVFWLSATPVTVTVDEVVLVRVTLLLDVDQEYDPPDGDPVAVIVVEVTKAGEPCGGVPDAIGTAPSLPLSECGVVHCTPSTSQVALAVKVSEVSMQHEVALQLSLQAQPLN